MKRVGLYMHGGAWNRGCEAIIRCTVKLLGKKQYTVYSRNECEDKNAGLNEICHIKAEGLSFKPYTMQHVILRVKQKLLKCPDYMYRYRYNQILQDINKQDYWISVGGDNYCGYGFEGALGYLNEQMSKGKTKTVLFGCSIEPDTIPELAEDLGRYTLIVARESITYNALIKNNVLSNIILLPDPAFILTLQQTKLPEKFLEGETVGINVSPLILKEGKTKGLVLNAYRELIIYIIKNTKYHIVLIPHVVKKNNDDLIPLSVLFDEFKQTGRISLIGENKDLNCMQLKYIISKCRFVVTARTHASIAAYSTCVPTLVVGYSVKAKGIAKDIFGNWENYVINVQDIYDKEQIKNQFVWLEREEEKIKLQLKKKMPEYVRQLEQFAEKFENILEDEENKRYI